MRKIVLLLLPGLMLPLVARSQSEELPNQPREVLPMSQVAKGTFEVTLAPLSFEGAEEAWKLGRMSIDKKISGDLVATTKGEMLSARTDVQDSAGYVAIEHVTGTLHGRTGSFVLQHTGTMNRGEPSLRVTVVPDSGTGELAGLEGDFAIDIVDGKHFYEFTYVLSETPAAPVGQDE